MRLRSRGGISGPKDALQRRSHPSLAARKFLTPRRHGAGVSRSAVPPGTALASLLPRAWRGIDPCSLPCPTFPKAARSCGGPGGEGLMALRPGGACSRIPLPGEGQVPARSDPEECGTRRSGPQPIPSASEPSLIAAPAAAELRRAGLPCDYPRAPGHGSSRRR